MIAVSNILHQPHNAMLVSVIPFSITVHGLPRRARKFVGVSREFGRCTRGNWSPVQDMFQIGWQVFAHILLSISFQGGRHVPPVPPKSATAMNIFLPRELIILIRKLNQNLFRILRSHLLCSAIIYFNDL